MFDLVELARWDEALARLSNGVPSPRRETAAHFEKGLGRDDAALHDRQAGRCPVVHEARA